MKHIIFIISIFIQSISCISQDQNQITVYYIAKFNPRFDRGREDISYTAKLMVSGGKSRFFMMPVEDYEKADENDLRYIPDTSMQIYVDSAGGKLFSMEHSLSGKSFYISDSLYPMEWIVKEDTMLIGKLMCRKAVCDFRGRHYIAWYAEDIMIPYGPWKMGGLPGLILDLQDEDDNLIIKMESISYQESKIQLPSSIKYTYKEYVDSMRKFLENLRAGGRASSSGYCMTCQNQSTYELVTWEKMFW